MIKVQIKKENEVTNQSQFETLVQANQWIQQEELNKSFGEPESYEVVFEDITEEIEQEKINQEALAYLAETDWYVIRAMDEQVAIPEDVKAKRQESRNKIKR